MEIAQIRRLRLRQWIDEDPCSKGNVTSWCNHYSQFSFRDADDSPISPTYIRQIVPKRSAPTRNLGEKAARRLERIGGKEAGWLDRLDDGTPAAAAAAEDARGAVRTFRTAPVAAHGLPVLAAEEIVQGGGELPERFIWEAEDDMMPGGIVPAPRGQWVVLDATVECEPGDVVLVRIGRQRPLLRRITGMGSARQLVTNAGGEPARPVTADCTILAVALYSHPRPLERRRRI
ncbi:hypothetical protein [Pseudothauera rhizosphaerae]|uniref:Peptidase S24/S26A/S26B/S26C domain-containing protein n=1 Tax=Pseudothauera rhizosphaerae TaxID=2565932 RepID=A0A4S4B0J5_9RHOO|nr:hypothetical protein [Pseudothauera rhizosphaerae]THF65154.1 hypothetical protein E6O51_00695 [Pseudothauera rhizosphaerae]